MKNIILLLFLFALSSGLGAQTIHTAEVSLLNKGGNSDVVTYLFKTTNKWQRPETKNIFTFDGHYTYGETDGELKARDWDLIGTYAHLIEEKLALTGGEVIEGYFFQGIKARYSTDLGLRRYLKKDDKETFAIEAGYRYTIEDRYYSDDQYENKLRFYSEYSQKVNDNFAQRHWIEAIPNLTNTKDYLINFESSIITTITQIFSLKVGYKGMYDQEPAIDGKHQFDYTFTTSLLAKWD